VVDRGLEWSDVGGGIVDNVTVERDEVEEVLIYKFFLGVPKFLVVLVNDCVLVRVVVSGGGTDGGWRRVEEKDQRQQSQMAVRREEMGEERVAVEWGDRVMVHSGQG